MFDDQDGRTPTEGLVGKSAGDGIPRCSFAPAGAAPGVRGGDVAEDLGFHCAQALPNRGES